MSPSSVLGRGGRSGPSRGARGAVLHRPADLADAVLDDHDLTGFLLAVLAVPTSLTAQPSAHHDWFAAAG
jgi:hypothetical protein